MASLKVMVVVVAAASQPTTPDTGMWGVQPGDNGLMPSENCLPFADCMPIEECIQFIYSLDLATHEAVESAIENICFHDQEEKD